MNRKWSIFLVPYLIFALHACQQGTENQEFEKIRNSGDWNMAFEDPCTGDWTRQWALDGLIATVENTDRGMHFSAGPEAKNDAHHAVMWTREAFSGDIRIEYDYTRTDRGSGYVNILYIQATGDGEGSYVSDISAWAHLREVPSMRTYFMNMNALHISYAVGSGLKDSSAYVRARRYPRPDGQPFDVTRIQPSYDGQGQFVPGKTYHITAIKSGQTLWFQAENKDGKELFSWDLSEWDPVCEGRVGLRHMYTRSAIYRDFRIYTKAAPCDE